LAENSVRWASFADYEAKEWVEDVRDGTMGKGVRAKRLKEWIGKWERFCAWVVDEFGVDENVEPGE
jgi:adenosine deaminase CECR1